MMNTQTETITQPSTSTTMPDATKARLQELADKGTQLLQKTVESVVATGLYFIEVRASLRPGQFGLIFTDDIKHIARPDRPDRPMGIAQHQAEQYMAIARNRVLAESTRWVDLPSSYRTLYHLSLLPLEVLERHINSGTVSPQLTRTGAEALVYRYKRWRNFATENARETVAYRTKLDRRDAVQSYPCQCICGHKHIDQRLKSGPRPPDPGQKPEGKGEA